MDFNEIIGTVPDSVHVEGSDSSRLPVLDYLQPGTLTTKERLAIKRNGVIVSDASLMNQRYTRELTFYARDYVDVFTRIWAKSPIHRLDIIDMGQTVLVDNDDDEEVEEIRSNGIAAAPVLPTVTNLSISQGDGPTDWTFVHTVVFRNLSSNIRTLSLRNVRLDRIALAYINPETIHEIELHSVVTLEGQPPIRLGPLSISRIHKLVILDTTFDDLSTLPDSLKELYLSNIGDSDISNLKNLKLTTLGLENVAVTPSNIPWSTLRKLFVQGQQFYTMLDAARGYPLVRVLTG